eukprot:3826816-Heterocapsa_arctica.AAC.1
MLRRLLSTDDGAMGGRDTEYGKDGGDFKEYGKDGDDAKGDAGGETATAAGVLALPPPLPRYTTDPASPLQSAKAAEAAAAAVAACATATSPGVANPDLHEAAKRRRLDDADSASPTKVHPAAATPATAAPTA